MHAAKPLVFFDRDTESLGCGELCEIFVEANIVAISSFSEVNLLCLGEARERLSVCGLPVRSGYHPHIDIYVSRFFKHHTAPPAVFLLVDLISSR